jgi:hypothetical protein
MAAVAHDAVGLDRWEGEAVAELRVVQAAAREERDLAWRGEEPGWST